MRPSPSFCAAGRKGDIQIQDLVFHSNPTGDEDDLEIVVYYYDEPRRR